jgi:hypothetical protein
LCLAPHAPQCGWGRVDGPGRSAEVKRRPPAV